MKKLRMGVVGVGYLGKFHAEKYVKMDDVFLAGVVDINKKQAHDVAEKVCTTAYTNYKHLFGKVDAVSIAVPTPFHFAISKDFLKNNVHVLIEKPITTTLREADELMMIAKSNKSIIQVGHLERYNPAVVALQDIIGDPIFVESHRLCFFKNRCLDVSVVIDLMIHDIDIILNFVKSEIKDICAAGISVISEHVDIANARLEFTNGCIANVTASRISTKNERKLRLFQKDAYISVDFANRNISTIRKQSSSNQNELIPGMDIQKNCFTKGDALEDELLSFVRAVKNKVTPEVTGQMGRDALKIALNIMEQINITNKSFVKKQHQI